MDLPTIEKGPVSEATRSRKYLETPPARFLTTFPKSPACLEREVKSQGKNDAFFFLLYYRHYSEKDAWSVSETPFSNGFRKNPPVLGVHFFLVSLN